MRPYVSVYGKEKEEVAQVPTPAVFGCPVRHDLVHFVHTNMAKNRRQAYAVFRFAGEQTSAESWGTGRAKARIPRVKGSGTRRAVQGAFGNMCRGGRMFAPTKTYRKWHRKININVRRYAVCSALAASALPALVTARGHKIDNVPEVPLVVSNEVESMKRTVEAVALLKSVGAYADVEKAKDSKKVRAGRGKMRGRRYKMRRGPLVVYNTDDGITKAFRNLPGVELEHVSRLNLLLLAPGAHMGRFIIWSQGAFEKLDSIYGTQDAVSEQKKGFKPPAMPLAIPDLHRLINSDEIQSVVRPAMIRRQLGQAPRPNPLGKSQKSKQLMDKLNPFSRRAAKAAAQK